MDPEVIIVINFLIRHNKHLLLFISEKIIKEKDIYQLIYKNLLKNSTIVGNSSLYPSFSINNSKIILSGDIINVLFGSMPEINNYLHSMITANYLDIGDIEIINPVIRLFFIGILFGLIAYNYKISWDYFFLLPSAYTTIYTLYMKHNNNLVFVLLTYLFLLSYTYTEFNWKIMNKMRNLITKPAKAGFISLNRLIDSIFGIDLADSISTSIPNFIKIKNYKDFFVRLVLVNLFIRMNMYLELELIGGGTKKTLKKQMTKNKGKTKAKTKTKTKTKAKVKAKAKADRAEAM